MLRSIPPVPSADEIFYWLPVHTLCFHGEGLAYRCQKSQIKFHFPSTRYAIPLHLPCQLSMLYTFISITILIRFKVHLIGLTILIFLITLYLFKEKPNKYSLLQNLSFIILKMAKKLCPSYVYKQWIPSRHLFFQIFNFIQTFLFKFKSCL